MVSEKVKNQPRSLISVSPAGSIKASSYFLKKGDVIAIVAPASAPPADVIGKAKAWIEKNGFVALIPDDILKSEIYLSNSDQYRFNHLKSVLQNPKVNAIWCIRGGYGCSRLIPELVQLKKPKEKLFIGISDITTLHLLFTKKWNWRTLHGPLMDRLAENKLTAKNEEEMMQAILGQKKEFIFDGLTALNSAGTKNKKIQAPVVGGNLTVLTSNFGTPAEIAAKKHILFLEDLSERGYRIDRMLQQIKQSKAFKHCQAIVFGDFLGGDEPAKQGALNTAPENHVQATLRNFAEQINIPVFSGLLAGHGAIQRPLFFNTKAVLFSGANPKLTVYNG